MPFHHPHAGYAVVPAVRCCPLHQLQARSERCRWGGMYCDGSMTVPLSSVLHVSVSGHVSPPLTGSYGPLRSLEVQLDRPSRRSGLGRRAACYTPKRASRPYTDYHISQFPVLTDMWHRNESPTVWCDWGGRRPAPVGSGLASRPARLPGSSCRRRLLSPAPYLEAIAPVVRTRPRSAFWSAILNHYSKQHLQLLYSILEAYEPCHLNQLSIPQQWHRQTVTVGPAGTRTHLQNHEAAAADPGC